MMMRTCYITTTLLASAGLLATSSACSSAPRGPSTGQPRQDAKLVAAPRETRPQAAETREPRLEMRTAAPRSGADEGTARATTPLSDAGALGGTERRERVTMAAPPPLTQVEFPSHQPRDGEFWVPGHWRGDTGQYVWESGRIDQRRASELFHAARWDPTENGWAYTPEHWR